MSKHGGAATCLYFQTRSCNAISFQLLFSVVQLILLESDKVYDMMGKLCTLIQQTARPGRTEKKVNNTTMLKDLRTKLFSCENKIQNCYVLAREMFNKIMNIRLKYAALLLQQFRIIIGESSINPVTYQTRNSAFHVIANPSKNSRNSTQSGDVRRKGESWRLRMGNVCRHRAQYSSQQTIQISLGNGQTGARS